MGARSTRPLWRDSDRLHYERIWGLEEHRLVEGSQTYGWTGGSKALNRTCGIHCLSSFKGRVNGWARFRRPGRLVRIGGRAVNFWASSTAAGLSNWLSFWSRWTSERVFLMSINGPESHLICPWICFDCAPVNCLVGSDLISLLCTNVILEIMVAVTMQSGHQLICSTPEDAYRLWCLI